MKNSRHARARLPVLALAALGLVSAPRLRAREADIAVLLIGNSHSSRQELPKMLRSLIEAGNPGKSVVVETAPRWSFLVDRLNDGVTQKKLESKAWTHVVLQAQKYSTSGLYRYPTDAAEEWIRRIRGIGATPILFPEWARRGNSEEGYRVHALHEAIAAREPACVAPVGLAWERSLSKRPEYGLHDADGNHANRSGSLLTAYVLYEVITGNQAVELPPIESLKVQVSAQAFLSAVASTTIDQEPACENARE